MKFIPFEIAKKLKEKGFKEECLSYYTTEYTLYNNKITLTDDKYLCLSEIDYEEFLVSHNSIKYTNVNYVDAPTIEQVLEWFREKDIIVYCKPYFTMATKNHIMYEWNVDVFNVDTKETKEDNENVCLTYVDNDFGYVRYSSFDCIADYDDAILAGIEYTINNLI